jgi:hypothetical protein
MTLEFTDSTIQTDHALHEPVVVGICRRTLALPTAKQTRVSTMRYHGRPIFAQLGVKVIAVRGGFHVDKVV